MAPRRSLRIHQQRQAQLQRRLADHLREVEAARIRAGEPRRSIRLHFHFDRRIRYFIFGEEGYINANDPFDPDEFPTFGWRVDRWREIREEQERQDALAASRDQQQAGGHRAGGHNEDDYEHPQNTNNN